MKFINSLFLLFAVVSLSSCDYLPTLENEAKKAVASNLIDSESARFENVFTPSGGGVVCGFVNGKNHMGGYAGSRPFIYTANIKGVLFYEKSPTKSDIKSLSFYSGYDLREKIGELMNACKFPSEWKTKCKLDFASEDNQICDAINKGELPKLLDN